VSNVETPLTPEDIQKLGCRRTTAWTRLRRRGLRAGKFSAGGKEYLRAAPKTMRNTNTAWWDASQLYGFDDRSRQRVKRDPADSAKLLLTPAGASGQVTFRFSCRTPRSTRVESQEAAGFPDNWTIGMSFYHNVFAREHNAFVTEFRRLAAQTPNADSGCAILPVPNRSSI